MKWECNLFEEKSKSVFTELVNRIGVAKSEKYPYFKQDAMSLNLLLNTQIINIIFIDSELSIQFANYIYNLSSVVQNDYFKNSINIVEELCGVFEMIGSMMDLARNKQEENPLCI